MSKPLTVATLLVAVIMLGLVGMCWWMPVCFGYPWYTVIGNLFLTAIYAMCVWLVVDVVSG
jgi:hypothetical protein